VLVVVLAKPLMGAAICEPWSAIRMVFC
jgi:hypothetical protein